MPYQAPTYPLFQVIRKGPRTNKSVALPINLAACPAGTAFIEATPAYDQDASTAVALSSGTNMFAGFITRDVLAATGGVPTVPVPTYSELSSGASPNIPFETQFSAGFEGSLEDAEEYEAEGATLVSSGNGAYDVSNTTPIGTPLSFYQGKTCVAQAGQWTEFVLAEQMTPSVPGNVRIRARKTFGAVGNTVANPGFPN